MKKLFMSCSILLMILIGLVSIGSTKDLPTALPEEVGLSSKRLARIDNFIQNYIDGNEIAGAVALVARRGKVAHFEAYGMADIEDRKPMSKDSMFRICSMTKAISAVAGMIVWEEGHFRLSDPVSKYIPEMKDLTVIEYDPKDRTKYQIVLAKRPMRIINAFNFTAGFTYKGFLAGPVLTKMLDEAGLTNGFNPLDFDLAEYFRRRSRIPFLNHPGEKWNYGMHLQVVARLVEISSGMRFGDFCRERIFKPLGMKDTYFFVPEEKMPRVASLYFNTKDGLEKAKEGEIYVRPEVGEDPLDPYWFNPKGPKKFYAAGEGLITTTQDYAKFLQMMLNGGELNGVRILGRKTIEFMTTNHVDDIPCCRHILAVPGWGLGVAVVRDPGESHVIGSSGAYYWGGWMSTRWMVDPKEELLLVIMTQVLPSAESFRNKFIDMVYQAIID